jgi:hypothetical protein
MKEKAKILIQPCVIPDTNQSFVNVHINNKTFEFTSDEFKALEGKIEDEKVINSLCRVMDIISEQKGFIDKINVSGNLDACYNLILWFQTIVERELYETTKKSIYDINE